MNHKNATPLALVGGPYVVAKGCQMDTRKNERVPHGRPLGPINGIGGARGDVLTAGDAISADDLQGGAVELAQMIKLGMVVPQSGSSTPPEAA